MNLNIQPNQTGMGTIIFEQEKQESILLRKIIHQHGKKRYFQTRSIVIEPGDYPDTVYYIDSGRAKYTHFSPDGKEKVIMLLESGAFFGEGPTIKHTMAPVFVVVDSQSVLYTLSRSKFEELLMLPEFNRIIIKGSSIKVGILMKEIESLCFRSCKDRLLSLLVTLVDTEKVYLENYYKVRMKFTHQQLGDIIGASRVTVTNLLKELNSLDKYILQVNNDIYVHKKICL